MINPTLTQTPHQKRFRILLVVYGLLVSSSAFITALVIFLIPSDPRNNFLLGLSLQRFILIVTVLLPGIWAVVFTVRAYRDEAFGRVIWSRFVGNEMRLTRIVQVSAAGSLTGLFFFLTPAYIFADYKDYFFRLSPLIHWITFIGAVTFGMALAEKYSFRWEDLLNELRAQKKSLVIAFISLFAFIFIWILMAWTGLGIRIIEDYWYGAGVPILALQVVIAFVIGMGLFLFEKSSRVRFPARSEFLIFFVIWIVTAFLWIQEPLPDGFFATAPSPPNFEYFPYSDGSTFDIGSQFALIGQGINNGVPFDRVLYMVFLVYLHAFAGQNYLEVIAWQTGIYAVFPGILYLLGRAIHGRTFGVILAALAVMRGINGIAASNLIDLANQKQMLTDFPMAIFVVWFTLMLVKWLKAPNTNYPYMLWAGGAAGLAIMLRTHALFLLAFGILLTLIIYGNQRSRGMLVSFLLLLGALASILPWGVQNGGAILEAYKLRIQARYLPFLSPATPTPPPQGGTLLDFGWEPGMAAVSSSRALPLSASHSPSFSKASTGDVFELKSGKDMPQTLSLYTSIATNFFHNFLTSVLILPTSPVFHDLRYALKEAAPFWRQYWDGELGIGSGFFLFLNLFLISLGVGISWKSAGNSGLVPLGIFFFYNLANAAARTSGGRYIVPVDWIVFFYFALGLLQVIFWGRLVLGIKEKMDADELSCEHAHQTAWSREPLKRVPWILFFFIFVGSFLPLSEYLFPRKYPARSEARLLLALEQQGKLKEMGFDKAELSSFAEQWPAFTILEGRALYPRFFLENKGLPKNQYPYGVLDYPRLGFTMIGPKGVNFVVLPEDRMPYFPNASDVIVLGCKNAENIDALAVIVIDDRTVVYVRQPASTLQCPLQ